MKGKRTLKVCVIIGTSILIIAAIGACTRCTRDKSTGCNSRLAHVEMHGGVEVMVELERDRNYQEQTETFPEAPPVDNEPVNDYEKMA